MKQKSKRIIISLCLLAAFVLWTALVCTVDVRPIGPRGSAVGFSTMNAYVHNLFGVNMALYIITDWLGLVPIAFAFGFAILGLTQWMRRRSIAKVDYSILALGVYYLVVIGAYLLFESVVVNYRPVLIEGYLEASYPSSTTMLVLSVMPTAIVQLKSRIKSRVVCHIVCLLLVAFITFMVISRLVSGVHWLSDIIGSVLFSLGLVQLYRSVCDE